MPTATIDPARCPLCGAGNRCVVAQGGAAADCWCMQASISTAALARIPESLRDRACLCPRCAVGANTHDVVQEFEPHA